MYNFMPGIFISELASDKFELFIARKIITSVRFETYINTRWFKYDRDKL
jgi:hypothetical protein